MQDFETWKKDWKEKVELIEDTTLSDFEKVNLKRSLAGIEPLTIQEYNQQQIVYGNC